jgi:glycosyltransferase involved in cell wall biosynthesis
VAVLRRVILCFVAYYLPGERSGGPVRSIANFVEHFGDEFDIRIVSRDRDMLDKEPYAGIVSDDWNIVGKAQVFYASNKTVRLSGIAKLLRNTPYDVLYLNSFFAFDFTFLPLLAFRLGLARRKSCVIAPRGEFSRGAISLKAAKKGIYLRLVKAFKLYENLHWQASSDFEKCDIERKFGLDSRWVHVAPDLTPLVSVDQKVARSRDPGPLRLVFLSRISPKKNLDFLLRVLEKVTANVELAIYGPQEDSQHWKECRSLISQLPKNIKVTVGNQVPQAEVRDVFAAYDVFVFPTRGENFGHVIFESLIAGTPTLVSDQTPWCPDAHGGLQVLGLVEALWVDKLEGWAKLDIEKLANRRRAASDYARTYVAQNQSVQQNRQLFNMEIMKDAMEIKNV